ncbi:hypothetical protein AVEN_267308-1 [Araneus ventricosus]|uniref:Uncharacterized protein n=1 Tax=Araneus ventricosus TaxID=182803 RepID=A0A4Y2DJH1_ARAVE|nr:hypothetical protein AVEN_267308-1 [Araneus ventricosus]
MLRKWSCGLKKTGRYLWIIRRPRKNSVSNQQRRTAGVACDKAAFVGKEQGSPENSPIDGFSSQQWLLYFLCGIQCRKPDLWPLLKRSGVIIQLNSTPWL